MHDHEVATDHIGTRHPCEVELVVVPNVHAFFGRSVESESLDPVSYGANGEGIGVGLQEATDGRLIEDVPRFWRRQ